jgi:hypothetical protein
MITFILIRDVIKKTAVKVEENFMFDFIDKL